jgi:hypothetical protein
MGGKSDGVIEPPTKTELAAPKQAVHRHLSNPDTLLIDGLLVQAWGAKPD